MPPPTAGRHALPARVPTADDLIRLLSPERAPELKGLVLNACRTRLIGAAIHDSLPHLAVVCWKGVVLDGAAKAFAHGFFTAIADGPEGSVSVATAFDAGRAAFLRKGYVEGDPEAYLHAREHEHWRVKFPGRKTCVGCNPPVHGEPVLIVKGRLSSG